MGNFNLTQTTDNIGKIIQCPYGALPINCLALNGQYFKTSDYPDLANVIPNMVGGEYYSDIFPTTISNLIVDVGSNYSKLYVNGKYIFVSSYSSNTGVEVIYSTDGSSWTEYRQTGYNLFYSIGYGNGLYVAGAYAAGPAYGIFTSTDLTTWTNRTSGANSTIYGIDYGSSLYVVCTTNSSNYVTTSSNGISWTARTTPAPTGGYWKYIKWNGSLFLVVGNAYTSAATSPNGISWTAVTLPVTATWTDLQWNGTQFILTTSSSSICLTSSNGSTWTQNVTPMPILSITWNGTYWVAIGSKSITSYVQYSILFSKDGSSWTSYIIPNKTQTVTYPGPYVILSDGSGNCVIQNNVDAITKPLFLKSVPVLPGYKYLPNYSHNIAGMQYVIKAK